MSQELPPPQSQVLNLDDRLMLMSIQESSQLLDHLLATLQRPNPHLSREQLRSLCLQIQLRLTYFLTHSPAQTNELDRAAYQTLHRHCRQLLAPLDSSARYHQSVLSRLRN